MDVLNILWTSGDLVTGEKMVLMYATNSMLNSWWKKVTVLIWGGSAQLIANSPMLQEKIKMAIHTGVEFVACKGCSDQLQVSDLLVELGIKVCYLGRDLTELIKEDAKLITI